MSHFVDSKDVRRGKQKLLSRSNFSFVICFSFNKEIQSDLISKIATEAVSMNANPCTSSRFLLLVASTFFCFEGL